MIRGCVEQRNLDQSIKDSSASRKLEVIFTIPTQICHSSSALCENFGLFVGAFGSTK